MNRNQLLLGIVVLALVALGGGIWYVTMGPGSKNGTVAVATGNAAFLKPDDRTLGDPKAKIVAIEYASPMCPHCAHFNEEGIPVLKKNYIDPGKVFYIFRVFPIGQADIAAESLARCLPADNYFAFIDQLYRNQDKWDPENGVQDATGALIAQARIAGMSGDKASACMGDKAKNDRVMAVANEGTEKYGINGTPTFVINGEVQEAGAQWPIIKAKLDSLLAKK